MLALAVSACTPVDDDASSGEETGAIIPQECEGWCDVRFECADVERQGCLDNCAMGARDAGAMGPDCAATFRTFTNCVAALSCPDYDVWADPNAPPGYPCEVEDGAVEVACPDLFGP